MDAVLRVWAPEETGLILELMSGEAEIKKPRENCFLVLFPLLPFT